MDQQQQQFVPQGTVVGTPVRVNPTEEKIGPFFQPEFKEQLVQAGEWSDGIFDCMTDVVSTQHAALSCCCPCVSLYYTLDKIGHVPSGFRFRLDKTTFAVLFLAILFFRSIVADYVPPNISCQKIHLHHREPGGGHESSGNLQPEITQRFDVTVAPSPGGPSETEEEDSRSHTLCYTAGKLVGDIAIFLLMFLTLRAIRDKVQVREQEPMTLFKSLYVPYFCICWNLCFVAQVGRHVNRLQGFWPIRGTQYTPVHPAMYARPPLQPFQGQGHTLNQQPGIQQMQMTPGIQQMQMTPANIANGNGNIPRYVPS